MLVDPGDGKRGWTRLLGSADWRTSGKGRNGLQKLWRGKVAREHFDKLKNKSKKKKK